MRAIGMDAFRAHQTDYFTDSYICKQIQAIVNIGNDLLTRRRFCPLADLTEIIVECTCLLLSISEWKQEFFKKKLIRRFPSTK